MDAREPGQYGREVLRRIVLRALVALAVISVITVGLGLAVGTHSPVFLVAEVVALAVMFAGDRYLTPRLDRRIRGYEGERHVGALLDGLASQGWLTIHDVAVTKGNVDHIVIGPGGVLTVETKSHGGRIRTSSVNPAWLRQAYAQGKLVERITGMKTDSLLVFSRAYLVGKAVSRQRGVLVLPARMLAGHLARRPPVLTPEQVRSLHLRLSETL
jgi:hypothetical protein